MDARNEDGITVLHFACSVASKIASKRYWAKGGFLSDIVL